MGPTMAADIDQADRIKASGEFNKRLSDLHQTIAGKLPQSIFICHNSWPKKKHQAKKKGHRWKAIFNRQCFIAGRMFASQPQTDRAIINGIPPFFPIGG